MCRHANLPGCYSCNLMDCGEIAGIRCTRSVVKGKDCVLDDRWSLGVGSVMCLWTPCGRVDCQEQNEVSLWAKKRYEGGVDENEN